MGDWEGRFVASCFIWAQLDLIFKKRTEAESTGTVTIATELMGCHGKRVNKESEDKHTHRHTRTGLTDMNSKAIRARKRMIMSRA